MESPDASLLIESKSIPKIVPRGDSRLNLSALPAEDVIYRDIFSKLSLKDLCNLREADRTEYGELVDGFLSTVKVLDFPEYDLSPRHLELLSKKCVNVKEVDLTRSSITSRQAKRLFDGKDGITSLNLSYTTTLDSACLQSVIINCKGLKILKLRGCQWLTRGCLQVIALHQRNLETLDISRCYQAEVDDVLFMCFSRLSKLRSLNVAKTTTVSLPIIKTVLLACHNLEYLEFSTAGSCSELNAGLRKITKGLPNLKKVTMHSTGMKLIVLQAVDGRIY